MSVGALARKQQRMMPLPSSAAGLGCGLLVRPLLPLLLLAPAAAAAGSVFAAGEGATLPREVWGAGLGAWGAPAPAPEPVWEQAYDYCVVGGGPAGLQLGYFLQAAGRDYVILEKGEGPGTFFRKYPRHRTLISSNKRFTGRDNKEFVSARPPSSRLYQGA